MDIKWKIVGHSLVKKVLESHLQSKKFLNAYRFVGSRGLGKMSLAKEFASFASSESYSLFDADTGDAGSFREFLSFANFKFSSTQFFLIDNASSLSLTAVSALLKTLEEAKEGVVFVLADHSGSLPDTIVSRCVSLRFGKLSSEQMKEVAVSAGIKTPEKFASFVSGNPAVFLTEASQGHDLSQNFFFKISGISKTEALAMATRSSEKDSGDLLSETLLMMWKCRSEFLGQEKNVVRRLAVLLKAYGGLRSNFNKKFILEEVVINW